MVSKGYKQKHSHIMKRVLKLKGKPSWNKGLKGYTNSGSFIKGHKGSIGEKNRMWKGNSVSIGAIHSWVKQHKKRVKLCQKCHKNKVYDLANISGKYKRDINDYKWICRSCHMKEDGRIDKLQKIIRRRKDGKRNKKVS